MLPHKMRQQTPRTSTMEEAASKASDPIRRQRGDSASPSRPIAGFVIGLALIAACSGPSSETVIWTPLAPIDLPPLPDLDFDRVRQGAALYADSCAECHRPDLSGDPEWKTRTEDGGLRPPPHDASGHTWHHPDDELVEIVLRGYDFPVPDSRMPQFGETLTEDEVRAILEFIKASWGTEERMYQWEQTVRRQRRG